MKDLIQKIIDFKYKMEVYNRNLDKKIKIINCNNLPLSEIKCEICNSQIDDYCLKFIDFQKSNKREK